MDVTVSQAASVLGVSDRRVRQLIKAGGVRARRVGSQWLIDGGSLRIAPRRGRPLSPSSIWTFLLSSAPPSAHPERWLERRERLSRDPEPGLLLASWAAARAERLLFTTREPGGVLEDLQVVRSGFSDPRAGMSAADAAEGYVARANLDQIRRRHLLRPTTGRPNVILHIVDQLPPDPVPSLVLAADLAEHEGARELGRADELIREAVKA